MSTVESPPGLSTGLPLGARAVCVSAPDGAVPANPLHPLSNGRHQGGSEAQRQRKPKSRGQKEVVVLSDGDEELAPSPVGDGRRPNGSHHAQASSSSRSKVYLKPVAGPMPGSNAAAPTAPPTRKQPSSRSYRTPAPALSSPAANGYATGLSGLYPAALSGDYPSSSPMYNQATYSSFSYPSAASLPHHLMPEASLYATDPSAGSDLFLANGAAAAVAPALTSAYLSALSNCANPYQVPGHASAAQAWSAGSAAGWSDSAALSNYALLAAAKQMEAQAATPYGASHGPPSSLYSDPAALYCAALLGTSDLNAAAAAAAALSQAPYAAHGMADAAGARLTGGMDPVARALGLEASGMGTAAPPLDAASLAAQAVGASLPVTATAATPAEASVNRTRTTQAKGDRAVVVIDDAGDGTTHAAAEAPVTPPSESAPIPHPPAAEVLAGRPAGQESIAAQLRAAMSGSTFGSTSGTTFGSSTRNVSPSTGGGPTANGLLFTTGTSAYTPNASTATSSAANVKGDWAKLAAEATGMDASVGMAKVEGGAVDPLVGMPSLDALTSSLTDPAVISALSAFWVAQMTESPAAAAAALLQSLLASPHLLYSLASVLLPVLGVPGQELAAANATGNVPYDLTQLLDPSLFSQALRTAHTLAPAVARAGESAVAAAAEALRSYDSGLRASDREHVYRPPETPPAPSFRFASPNTTDEQDTHSGSEPNALRSRESVGTPLAERRASEDGGYMDAGWYEMQDDMRRPRVKRPPNRGGMRHYMWATWEEGMIRTRPMASGIKPKPNASACIEMQSDSLLRGYDGLGMYLNDFKPLIGGLNSYGGPRQDRATNGWHESAPATTATSERYYAHAADAALPPANHLASTNGSIAGAGVTTQTAAGPSPKPVEGTVCASPAASAPPAKTHPGPVPSAPGRSGVPSDVTRESERDETQEGKRKRGRPLGSTKKRPREEVRPEDAEWRQPAVLPADPSTGRARRNRKRVVSYWEEQLSQGRTEDVWQDDWQSSAEAEHDDGTAPLPAREHRQRWRARKTARGDNASASSDHGEDGQPVVCVSPAPDIASPFPAGPGEERPTKRRRVERPHARVAENGFPRGLSTAAQRAPARLPLTRMATTEAAAPEHEPVPEEELPPLVLGIFLPTQRNVGRAWVVPHPRPYSGRGPVAVPLHVLEGAVSRRGRASGRNARAESRRGRVNMDFVNKAVLRVLDEE